MTIRNIFLNSALLSPIVLTATLFGSNSAIAAEVSVSPENKSAGAAMRSLPTQLTHSTTVTTSTQIAELPTPRPAAAAQPENLAEPVDISIDNPVGMSQVTSVSQLSDVQPTDWAFQALQSLVERYGCIAGYPRWHL